MSKPTMTVDKMDFRKKPQYSSKSRQVQEDIMNQEFMEVILETSNNDIKELLLKLKIEHNYDKNVKSFNDYDIHILKETWFTLEILKI